MIRQYIFKTTKEIKFSLPEDIKHQQFIKLERSYDGIEYKVLDITKYDIIDKSLITLNFKIEKETFIKISVADTGLELGEVAIPYKSDIEDVLDNLTETEQTLLQYIDEAEIKQTQVTNLKNNILSNELSINNGATTIENNTTTIENNEKDVYQILIDTNNTIRGLKTITEQRIIEKEPFNDYYTFDITPFNTLKDEAIADKNKAEIYANEADVSNNLDVSQIDLALSSINSSLDNIKASVVISTAAYNKALNNKNKCVQYKNKVVKWNTNGQFYSQETTNLKAQALDLKQQILDKIEEFGTITDIIDDGNIVGDKTYSSLKSYELITDGDLPENTKTSQEINEIKIESLFNNTNELVGVLPTDKIKYYRTQDKGYYNCSFQDLKNKIYQKDFMTKEETNSINYNTYLNISQSGNYRKTKKKSFIEYSNEVIVGYINGSPIFRNYFQITNNDGINFIIPKGELDIGNIINIQAMVSNETVFKNVNYFDDGINILIDKGMFSYCNVIIDSTIIDIIDDSPLLYENNFSALNTTISNATYDEFGKIVNNYGMVSEITNTPYEQEIEDGGFKEYNSQITLELQNLEATNQTTSTFKTMKQVVNGQELYLDNYLSEVSISGVVENQVGGDYTIVKTTDTNQSTTDGVIKSIGGKIVRIKQVGNQIVITRHSNTTTLPIEYTYTIDSTYFTNQITAPSIFTSLSSFEFFVNGYDKIQDDGDYFYFSVVIRGEGIANHLFLVKCLISSFSIVQSWKFLGLYGLDVVNGDVMTCGSVIDGYVFYQARRVSTSETYNTYLYKINLTTLEIQEKTGYYGEHVYKTSEGTVCLAGSGYLRNFQNFKLNIPTFSLTNFVSVEAYGSIKYILTPENHLIVRYYTESGGNYNHRIYSLNNANYGSVLYNGTTIYLPILGELVYLGTFNGEIYTLSAGRYLKYNINLGTYTQIYVNMKPMSGINGNIITTNVKNSDGKEIVFFNTNANQFTIDNRPLESEYTVTVPTQTNTISTVYLKPEITLKDGLKDDNTIVVGDLSEKELFINTELSGANLIVYETNTTQEQTDTKRFYMWNIVAEKFNKLKKVVTYFKKKG